MAELGRLLMYEASRDWLVSRVDALCMKIVNFIILAFHLFLFPFYMFVFQIYFWNACILFVVSVYSAYKST